MRSSSKGKSAILGWHWQALRLASGVVALALLFAACRADALDPSRTLTQSLHRIWQVPQGLPQATIYCVLQAHDGYLWLGTQTGLVKFDGVRFTSIGEAQGVSPANLWIRDLAEDGDHALWAAANGNGLIRLHKNSVARYSTNEGLPSADVHALFCDSKGVLWACTASGVASFSKGNFVKQGNASIDVWAACEAKDGTLWTGGDGPQLIALNSTTAPRNLASLPANASVRALLATTDGTLWIGATDGLVRLKDDKETRLTTADGLADNAVYTLAQGRDGVLWIGTKNGFSRLRNGEFESFRATDGLSQSTVYALCEDREGSLWVGTKHGLNQFLDRRTIPFTASEGLSSNDTGPVFQDRAGNVWVGTLDAGLNRFDGHHFTALTTAQGLASPTVRALADDGAGGVWVGTNHGINHLQGARIDQTYTTANGLPSDDITCLYRDRDGQLWAGTTAGPARFHDGRFTPLSSPEKSPVAAIIKQSDNSLFIAGRNGGLQRLSNDHLTDVAFDKLPRRGPVDAFYEDDDHLLWIGTLGDGLYLLDGAKAFRFSMRDGLFDDDIYGIVADDQDRLWMACSKGIFYVNRADLRKFAAGLLSAVVSTPFSPTDALRTVECKSGVQPAAWRMADGRLWFATVRGVIVVDPGRLRRNAPPPPVVIEEVIVNGRSENPAHIERLAPGLKNLEFRYTGLSFLSPGRMTFRYKLEGFDRDWIDAGARREAFYTNLPPGPFTFRVTAANADAPPNEAANPVAFVLAPHFYQRSFFIPLCIAAAALTAWLAYRLRVRRIEERLHTIGAERSRIARELHDTLLQGFSGVTMEMQALAARLPSSGERATLEEIIRDAGNCMREARRSVAGLRSVPGGSGKESGLATAIAQAARQLTETRDIRLTLKLDPAAPQLSADTEYNLLRITAEAVSNAVRHSGSRTLEVTLDRAAPRQLRLAIRDEGTGFDPSPASGAIAGHYGLIGMRERAAQIGAHLEVQSRPGRGTTITVSLPTEDSGAVPTAAAQPPTTQTPEAQWQK
jgi:signal transduction histidine kinase/ligand-binding sensor domain-containing protein